MVSAKSESAAFWEGFFNPPGDCAQTPFWFLNGEVDGEIYASQMEEMARKGVFQAMPHPRYGMDRQEYLTERYFDAFRQMAEQAREKGYRIHLYDEFNWSSGNAGGRLTKERENCALGIAIGTGRTGGSFTYSRWEEGFMGWGKMEDILIAGYAPYRSEEELDFGHCRLVEDYSCKDGVFHMEIEPGDWTAFVIYTVRTRHPSPLRQGNGGIVDYLNPEVTRQFIDVTHEAYYSHLEEFFGETIPSIFYDEVSPYACGNFTWTRSLPAVFLEEKGYDIVEKLPYLFFDGDALAPRIRCDYWDVVTKLFAKSFVGQIADWCDAHRIALTGHTYEDSKLWPVCGHLFRSLRAQQWVGLDSLLGYKPYSCLKPAVSVAHVTGKEMVVCEALGILGGWECTPADMKKAYNQLAVAGANLLVPHAFFETVENPKAECPPSFFDCNPYWQMYGEISAMTDLQCYINRKMAHVADIAVFYPVVSWQAKGRGGRGRTSPTGVRAEMREMTEKEYQQFDRIIDVLMSEQLDMDILDDVALEEGRMEGGSLYVAKESYRALVLPDMSTMRLADGKRILELAEGGLAVLASEAFRPCASAEKGMGDPELEEVMERLERHLHRFPGELGLAETLRRLMPADIYVESGEKAALDAAHRRLGGVDLYLLSHTGEKVCEYRVSVRCRNREKALLDCRGRRFPAEFTESGERTEVRFLAEPEEIYYFVLADETIPEGGAVMPECGAEDRAAASRYGTKDGGATSGCGMEGGAAISEGRAEDSADFAVFGKEHVLNSAQWEKLPMVQELKEFRFLPCPDGLEGLADRNAWEEMPGRTEEPAVGEMPGRTEESAVGEMPGRTEEPAWEEMPGRTEEPNGGDVSVCIDISANTDKPAYVDMSLPLCRTLKLLYESADGERLATVWEHWMDSGFDDGDWEVLSLKHGPKLYDHVGSRLFRFVLPAGTAAVRRPIPVNGEYALYLNGRLVEAVTEHMPEPASQEERWIPVEGCEEEPGILAIECSSMAPRFGVLSPVTVRVRACRTGLKDWKELGLGWYSGYCRYETEFRHRALKKGETLWLDLGQVKECAAVFLNGQKIGQRLWKPYRFDISRAVREGKNTLSIYSCNLIANEFAWDPLGTRGSASSLPSGVFGSVGLYLEEG